MKRLAFSIVTILFAGGVIASGATGAFFSDTETSVGNTFTAGAIDLKIDNSSYYNGVATSSTSWTATNLTIEKFFNFLDLKPNDYGEDTISLHVDTNDAYLCADVTLTSNNDNTQTEPEALVDGNGLATGELANLVNFIWWADDGDNVLETGENVISSGPIGALALNTPFKFALADADQNIWTGSGGPITGNTTYYVGKAWCFGTIGASPVPQDGSGVLMSPAGNNGGTAASGEPEDGGITCNGIALGNESQTDSLTADVSFEAVQARHNSAFQCERTPVFDVCPNPTLAFADNVVSSSQGVRKNGTPVLANRSNAASVLGPNESSGLPSDPAVPAGSFFSLGFKNNGASDGGSIIVEFVDNVIVDGPGNDLQVWEVTGGAYPDEHVRIEVSQDGINWSVAAADLTRDAQADLAASGLTWAKYIRLTDITPIAPFEPEADAYDLDAFSALHCGVPQI